MKKGYSSKNQVVLNPPKRTQCTSSKSLPRVPSFPYAIMSQTSENTLTITSVEEGWSSENVWKRRAVLEVSRSLEHTVKAEEFYMLSCKSLICLYSKHFSYICNPATGELRCLTLIDHERDGIGFGFDATQNQYKLVLLHLTDDKTWCDIFTLGTNSWTTAINEDRAVPQYDAKASCPTTIRESIYWITTPIMDVVSFNVESRKFKFIPAAMEPIDWKPVQLLFNEHYSLGEVLGDLCMVYHNGVAKRLWVFTLIEDAVRSNDEPQWRWRYTIDLEHLPAHIIPEHYVTLISVRGVRIILWSTWMGLVSYFEKPKEVIEVVDGEVRKKLKHEFDGVLYSGAWNQTVVYERSSTPLDDILLLKNN